MRRLLWTKLPCLVATLVIFASCGQRAEPAAVFYIANPTGNSVDWTNAVTSLGASINSNVDFDTHPLGALQNNFYSASDGVTFSTTGNFGGVVFGQGPGQLNTGFGPGEGEHAASNYLRTHPDINGGDTTTTVSFNPAVRGAGLFTIDFFDGTTSMILEAFDGPNGTGNLLGSGMAVSRNFQPNHLYFMGVTDASASIRSIRLFHNGAATEDVIGIDDIVYAPIPEPSTLILVGLGALGIIGYGWKRRRQLSRE